MAPIVVTEVQYIDDLVVVPSQPGGRARPAHREDRASAATTATTQAPAPAPVDGRSATIGSGADLGYNERASSRRRW